MIRRSLPRRTAAATAAAAGVVALAACGGNTPAQPVPTATPTPPSPAVQAVRDASTAFQAYVDDITWVLQRIGYGTLVPANVQPGSQGWIYSRIDVHATGEARDYVLQQTLRFDERHVYFPGTSTATVDPATATATPVAAPTAVQLRACGDDTHQTARNRDTGELADTGGGVSAARPLDVVVVKTPAGWKVTQMRQSTRPTC